MNNSEKHNFDPSRFGDLPTVNKSKSNNMRFLFLIFCALLVTALLLAAVLSNKHEVRNKQEQFQNILPRMETQLLARNLEIFPNPANICTGQETLCATVTTKKPAEAIKSLVSSMSLGTAKGYQIQLSVTPISE